MMPDRTHILQLEYDVVEPFYQQYGFYIVGKTNKMGVIRCHDNISDVIVPIEYDEIRILRKTAHLLIAKKSGLQKVIKITKNKTIMSQFYDRIGDYNDSGNFIYLDIIPVYRGQHVGVIDSSFEVIIPLQYESFDNRAFYLISIGVWEREMALVMRKNDHWGMLNSTGKVLLPFEYDMIDYKSVFYKWHKPNVKDVGFTRVIGSGLIPVRRDNKWGLIDLQKLSVVAQCTYKSIRQDSLNKLELIRTKGCDLLLFTKNGPQVISRSIDKLEQYSKVQNFKNGFAIVRKNEKYGFIDDAYNEIAPCIYDKVSSFEDGIAIVEKVGKYGCINERGNEFIPCKYDDFLPFTHGLAVVKLNELYGAINTKGQISIPFEYQLLADITIIGNSPILMAAKDKRIGAVDKNNKVIIPFEYDLLEPVFFGVITVIKNGKKGVFNKKGESVIPAIYDEINSPTHESGTYSVCNDGKWGVLNKNGDSISKLIYDNIDDYGFACGRLAVCRNNKWGFINRKGDEIIPCIYDKVIQWFEENHCEVILNGEKITIDICGNMI